MGQERLSQTRLDGGWARMGMDVRERVVLLLPIPRVSPHPISPLLVPAVPTRLQPLAASNSTLGPPSPPRARASRAAPSPHTAPRVSVHPPQGRLGARHGAAATHRVLALRRALALVTQRPCRATGERARPFPRGCTRRRVWRVLARRPHGCTGRRHAHRGAGASAPGTK